MAADSIAILDRFKTHVSDWESRNKDNNVGKDKKISELDRLMTDGKEIEVAVGRLCDEVIRQRLYDRPNNHTVEAFKALLTHLSAHYELYNFIHKHQWSYTIRRKVFKHPFVWVFQILAEFYLSSSFVSFSFSLSFSLSLSLYPIQL